MIPQWTVLLFLAISFTDNNNKCTVLDVSSACERNNTGIVSSKDDDKTKILQDTIDELLG